MEAATTKPEVSDQLLVGTMFGGFGFGILVGLMIALITVKIANYRVDIEVHNEN